jgi:hypothetical protein
MKRIIRATRTATASGVVALALLTACGGDPGDATTHLEARTGTSSAPAERNDAANRSLAERLERSAKLEGLARTYSNKADTVEDTSEFVSGSRHMPTR